MAKRTENKKENGCYAIGKWFAWVVALLVTGCSPKVATEIYHSYPATQADDIQVFKTGTNRPYSAELLGKVAVKGNGYTAHFSYDQVVALAKAETAKAGGNALAITEHKEPTILVSCHQIKGEMLRMKTQQREQIRKADSLELASRKSISSRPHFLSISTGTEVSAMCSAKLTMTFRAASAARSKTGWISREESTGWVKSSWA